MSIVPAGACAVPALVVVSDRIGPVPEPLAERLDEVLAVEGMLPELFPFGLRRPARLVEDLGAHLELPDVVEQGGPVQAIEVVRGEPELASEAVGVGADPLGVAACDPVVDVECADEVE